MKRFICALTITLSTLFCAFSNSNFGYVIPGKYEVRAYAVPGDHLLVTVSEKYGPTTTYKAGAVFQDKTTYRLVGKEIGTIDFMKSNINRIEVKHIKTKNGK